MCGDAALQETISNHRKVKCAEAQASDVLYVSNSQVGRIFAATSTNGGSPS